MNIASQNMLTDFDRREANNKLAKKILGIKANYAPVEDGWKKRKIDLVKSNTFEAY